MSKGKLYSPKGTLQYEGDVTNGVPNGKGIQYYVDWTVAYEGSFINGLRSGYGESFRPDGSLWYKGHHEEGKRTGDGEWYTSQGDLRFVGSFLNDKLNGEGKELMPDGSVLKEGIWRNGELEDNEGSDDSVIGQEAPDVETVTAITADHREAESSPDGQETITRREMNGEDEEVNTQLQIPAKPRGKIQYLAETAQKQMDEYNSTLFENDHIGRRMKIMRNGDRLTTYQIVERLLRVLCDCDPKCVPEDLVQSSFLKDANLTHDRGYCDMDHNRKSPRYCGVTVMQCIWDSYMAGEPLAHGSMVLNVPSYFGQMNRHLPCKCLPKDKEKKSSNENPSMVIRSNMDESINNQTSGQITYDVPAPVPDILGKDVEKVLPEVAWDPNFLKAQELFGNTMDVKSDEKKILDLCNKAINSDSSIAEYFILRAHVRSCIYGQQFDAIKSGILDGVLNDYSTALELDNASIGALMGLSGLYARQDEFKESLHYLVKALSNDLKSSMQIGFLPGLDIPSRTYTRYKRYLEGIDPNKIIYLCIAFISQLRFIKIPPSDIVKYEEVIKLYIESINDDSNGYVYYLVSRLYSEMAQFNIGSEHFYQDALQYMHKAVEISPENSDLSDWRKRIAWLETKVNEIL